MCDISVYISVGVFKQSTMFGHNTYTKPCINILLPFAMINYICRYEGALLRCIFTRMDIGAGPSSHQFDDWFNIKLSRTLKVLCQWHSGVKFESLTQNLNWNYNSTYTGLYHCWMIYSGSRLHSNIEKCHVEVCAK